MAVSKIAVIALVAVIAVPILLGYALNLTETTETDYKVTGETVNVSPLLQNGTDYSYSHGSTFQLNSNVVRNAGANTVYPFYKTTTTTKTSIQYTIYNTNYSASISAPIAQHNYLQISVSNSTQSDYVRLSVVDSGGTTRLTVDRLLDMIYIKATSGTNNTLNYSFLNASNNVVQGSTNVNYTGTILTAPVGNFAGTGGKVTIIADNNTWSPSYFDISGGYTLINHNQTSTNNKAKTAMLYTPTDTKTALLTMNLGSITDSTYSININNYHFEKTTTGGVVKWTWNTLSDPSDVQELYYDQTRSDNTYQLLLDISYAGQNNDPNIPYSYVYIDHAEMRYVGSWPSLIGEANYYQLYSFDTPIYANTSQFILGINFAEASKTPLVRFDDALFRAFEYPVIEDRTYAPADFKTNPSTTITNITAYGSSIDFGGNTYNVSKGNITLEGRSIPVTDLTFSSIPNESGTYDNKIGNTLISTSATPSTITFNGKWSASISTQSNEQYTYTKTEWNAGSFAWDGIDQNFLIVGLVTCLGVFVALGIYARKKGSGGIIPLMIAVGCAAMVFFIML